MRLLSIDQAQVTRLTSVAYPKGRPYLPDLSKALSAKYHFAEMPTRLDDWDQAKGISLLHGKYADVAIDKLSIFADGLVASSRCPTETVEAFVNDILAWFTSTYSASEAPIGPSRQAFDSTLLVQGSVDFERHLEATREIGVLLDKFHRAYGADTPSYRAGGFNMAADVAGRPLRAGMFTIERKANVPFEHNVYLSVAPLQTKDHLALLDAVERLFAVS